MKLRETSHNIIRNTRFAAQDITTLTRLTRGETLVPYIGFVGYQNLGDEVLLEAHQKLFPEYKFAIYRKESVIIERVTDAIGRPFSSQAILGGGTLINRGNHWIDRVEHLLARGSDIFCLGTGVANPAFWKGDNAFGGTIFSRWVKALGQFQFIGVRGPNSKKSLDKGGVKSVKVTGDTALALTEPNLRQRQSSGIVGVNYGSGVDSTMWGNPAQYRSELIKAIKAIVASGSKVVILPIRYEDIPSNKSLVEEINHPDCTLVISFDTYSDYSDKVRQCDVFIGQKLHSTIIAYMNRVPSIMIEYRPKCRDFMASLDLEEYVIKTSEFQLKPFMQLYDRLQKNHSSIRSKSESRILEYRQIQFDEAKRLSSIFAHKTDMDKRERRR